MAEDLDDLEEDELRYLRDRGRLTPEQEAEYLPDDLEESITSGESAAIPAGGASQPASQAAQLVADDNYNTLNKKDLQGELKERDLATVGTVPELRQRLRQHDIDLQGDNAG